MQTLYEQSFQDSSLFTVQRGPRYEAYAELRESKLRNRMIQQHQHQQLFQYNELQPNHLSSPPLPPPPQPIKERAVVIQSSPVINASGRNGRQSIVGRSVPNFSAVLRKENRKPESPVAAEVKTPPLKVRAVSKLGSGLNGGGSKSANGCAEKRGGIMMARRSCANIQELQGLSFGVSSAINCDGRGGGGGGRIVTRGVNSRAVLGSRLY